jgi:hypothetical protein
MSKQFKIDEAKEILRQFRILAVVTIAVILIGCVFYTNVEGWRWLDALYFSVISLATVGYGDFTPKTDAGKVFTMGYLIIGIAIFASLINILLKSRLAKRSLKTTENNKKD